MGEVRSQLTNAESRFVVVSVEEPDNPNPQRYVMPVEEFDNLFQSIDSTTALQRALDIQQQEQRGRGRRRGGGGRRQGIQRRPRVDYTSAEHAGEPHPGRITDAEKEFVRNNLDAINARLREQGRREIDPADPELAERYGLTTVAIDDAEAEGEVPRS